MIRLQLLQAGYQIIVMSAYPAGEPIKADELADLGLLDDVDLDQPIILFGQVPIWVYGRLVNLCQAAPWIGCFSAPVAEAVVIYSRVPEVLVGDVVAVSLLRPPAPAILVGGPPDSGKSVFSDALQRSIRLAFPACQVFLHRANWDGEGNWSHDTANRELVKRLVREHERRIHEQLDAEARMATFFDYHAKAVLNLRRVVDLVIVDVGGKPQREKVPVVEQCTHAIIISRAANLVEEWRNFCQPDLTLLGIIHSVLDDCCELVQPPPSLEITVGPWQRGDKRLVPQEILQVIAPLID